MTPRVHQYEQLLRTRMSRETNTRLSAERGITISCRSRSTIVGTWGIRLRISWSSLRHGRPPRSQPDSERAVTRLRGGPTGCAPGARGSRRLFIEGSSYPWSAGWSVHPSRLLATRIWTRRSRETNMRLSAEYGIRFRAVRGQRLWAHGGFGSEFSGAACGTDGRH